ncbi:hypothetical protein B0H14DRAFT_3527648 [Mycena olivaceomarginata]|nr:hypothetical protein B0H14DRAFT_3527648 [Mycena olivaceomarginata]
MRRMVAPPSSARPTPPNQVVPLAPMSSSLHLHLLLSRSSRSRARGGRHSSTGPHPHPARDAPERASIHKPLARTGLERRMDWSGDACHRAFGIAEAARRVSSHLCPPLLTRMNSAECNRWCATVFKKQRRPPRCTHARY